MKKAIIILILIFSTIVLSAFNYSDSLQYAVTQSPGTSQSDWAAIALTVSDSNFDKELYITKLKQHVSEKYQSASKLGANKATDWHRIAIAVNLLGYDATNFNGINLINDGIYYRENLGKQGLNGYIWALICISSGNYEEPADALNTSESILNIILSNQNPDGSFSLIGDTPSCDVTAMALYALSFYKNKTDVSAAIDKGFDYLISTQNEDGSFSENGIPNAESTAQVIIATSALGIDVNNNSPFPNIYDALVQFKTEDGFCHVLNGGTDIMATYQAFCAIASINDREKVYSNYKVEHLSPPPPEITTEYIHSEEQEITYNSEVYLNNEATTEITSDSREVDNNQHSVKKTEWQNLILLIIPVVFIVFCVIMRKRK